jgi:hypothetical protein
VGGACRGAGCDAGKRRAMCRMAGAALVEARSPTPARRTLNASRQGCPGAGDDIACHGYLHRSCQAHHRGGECPISGGRDGWCQGETDPAVSSVSRT